MLTADWVRWTLRAASAKVPVSLIATQCAQQLGVEVVSAWLVFRSVAVCRQNNSFVLNCSIDRCFLHTRHGREKTTMSATWTSLTTALLLGGILACTDHAEGRVLVPGHVPDSRGCAAACRAQPQWTVGDVRRGRARAECGAMSARASEVVTCRPVPAEPSEVPPRVDGRILGYLAGPGGACSSEGASGVGCVPLAENPAFLKDIGISRADALREASKPAWRR